MNGSVNKFGTTFLHSINTNTGMFLLTLNGTVI